MSERPAAAGGSDVPLYIGVEVELPAVILARARALSPRVVIVDGTHGHSLDTRWAQFEVLFAQSVASARLTEARSLRWLQSFGAGVDWLDGELVARRGIQVTNVSGIHADAIAEHVFAQLLALTRGIVPSVLQQAKPHWSDARPTESLRSLRGLTLGILGLGAIGLRVAEIGKVFGMRVLGLRRHAGDGLPPNVDQVFTPDRLPAFLHETDVLVNLLPLTRETRGLLGDTALNALPLRAIVINVGRGQTIDTHALLDAIREGHLGAAALDVTDPEPLPADHPLWSYPNVLITPHYAGAHPEYAQHAGEIFVDNLKRYLDGQPLTHVVDPHAGY